MSFSNTATRIIVSVIAIPAIVLACYFGEYYFFAFVLGIGTLSYFEYWQFVKNKDIDANFIVINGCFCCFLFSTNGKLHNVVYSH